MPREEYKMIRHKEMIVQVMETNAKAKQGTSFQEG
jgi:hypothetical protein